MLVRGDNAKGENQTVRYKMFTPEEVSCSSTHRELITILYNTVQFRSLWRGNCLISVLNGTRIINLLRRLLIHVGSMKLTLHALAYKLFVKLFGKQRSLSQSPHGIEYTA